ncbi:MAG: hypothetical protein KDJ16_16340 [Hyphomicrobiales bacterium]|nr:hypothetical protein [Hyphomicrobiales bacterium]
MKRALNRTAMIAGLGAAIVFAAPAAAEMPTPKPKPDIARALEAGSSAMVVEPALSTESDFRGSLGAVATDGEVLIVDQDIASLIKDFAKKVGIRADISRGVRGRVRDLRLPTEPSAFLDELARRYQIDWYFEGNALHVSAISEAASRMIGLGNVDFDSVRTEVIAAGLDPDRFAMKNMEAAKAVMVSGPPSYIARVELIVESLVNGRPSGRTVRVMKFGYVQNVAVR